MTGYLIPRDDVRTLTERLTRLIRDDSLRTMLGMRSREMFLSEFADTQMFAKVQVVYSEFAKAWSLLLERRLTISLGAEGVRYPGAGTVLRTTDPPGGYPRASIERRKDRHECRAIHDS